jgi:hypothetical protein
MTNTIDIGVKAAIRRRLARENTLMKSVKPGGIFVNRVVTTLYLTVQTPTWSVCCMVVINIFCS